MVLVIARGKAVVLLIYSSMPAGQSVRKKPIVHPHRRLIVGSIRLLVSRGVTARKSLVFCVIWRGTGSGGLGTKGLSLSCNMVCVVFPTRVSSLTCLSSLSLVFWESSRALSFSAISLHCFIELSRFSTEASPCSTRKSVS